MYFVNCPFLKHCISKSLDWLAKNATLKVFTKNLITSKPEGRIFLKSLHVFLSFCMNIFYLFIWGNHIKFLFHANSECKRLNKRNSFKSCKSKSLIFQYSSINRRWNLPEIPHKVQNWSPNQCCGTVTIFYGSGFGSYFWKVMFRFRFRLLKKLWFRFKKNVVIFFAFLHSKRFYKEKVYNFQQIYCKMWMKFFFNEGNQMHRVILYLVPVPEP
jgi:hypothetical protein